MTQNEVEEKIIELLRQLDKPIDAVDTLGNIVPFTIFCGVKDRKDAMNVLRIFTLDAQNTLNILFDEEEKKSK